MPFHREDGTFKKKKGKKKKSKGNPFAKGKRKSKGGSRKK